MTFISCFGTCVITTRPCHVQVEITSTTWRDWDTGNEVDFTDANCGTFYYGGADTETLYPACILGGGGGETVATSTNATVGCKNALASVCYTVSALGIPLFCGFQQCCRDGMGRTELTVLYRNSNLGWFALMFKLQLTVVWQATLSGQPPYNLLSPQHSGFSPSCSKCFRMIRACVGLSLRQKNNRIVCNGFREKEKFPQFSYRSKTH